MRALSKNCTNYNISDYGAKGARIGVIGSNKADAVKIVQNMLQDLSIITPVDPSMRPCCYPGLFILDLSSKWH